jgi:subtilisin family serine protease
VPRPTALLCLAALSASGLALAAPAVAAAPPAARPGAHAAAPDELVVGYVAGATPAAQERARGRAGAVRAERVVAARAGRAEVELVKLPRGTARAAAVRALESDPAVAYAEPNWTYTHAATPTDPYFTDGRLWGMRSGNGSNAAAAWTAGHVGSKAVHVGVIDEGIQVTHPDLDANVWSNPFDPANGRDDDGNGYVDDVHGYDFAGDDNTVYDGGSRGSLDDHGTHVAGTIGAEADGTGVVGVNHDVTMISGKFLGRRGGALADAVQAVDYFTDLKTRSGVNVVATNNSWGGGGYSQALFDAIRRADAAGILFVAAAGNSGTDNDATASYPSGYDLPNVIAVAAIDEAGALASFSQYGARTVDLGAPGVDVWSTTAFNTLSSYNGTSMATPHVTGAVALYAASHPGATAADIKAAVLARAVPTASLSGKTVTGGRLDASDF